MKASSIIAELIASARNLPYQQIPKLERELENNAIRLPSVRGKFDPDPYEISEVWDDRPRP